MAERFINTTGELTIPEGAEFFCLIGKRSNQLHDQHTFIQVGFVDEGGQARTLVEVGKVADMGLAYQDEGADRVCNVLLSHTGGVIKNEQRQLRQSCDVSRSFDISYAAFSLTKIQYLRYLSILHDIDKQQYANFYHYTRQLLQQWQSEQRVSQPTQDMRQSIDRKWRQYESQLQLYGYLPVAPGSTNYQYSSLDNFVIKQHGFSKYQQQQVLELLEDAQQLSVWQNCRHSGLAHLSFILDGAQEVTQQSVSSCFLWGMPCSVNMARGTFSQPLYILPQPPTAFSCNDLERRQLFQLYQRMQTLLQCGFYHPQTRAKFEALKSLYQNLTANQSANIDFLETIVAFARDDANKVLIDQHRSWHFPFFHKTKTAEMFDDFEQQLVERSSTNII